MLAQGEPPSIFRFRGVDRLLSLYPSREAALERPRPLGRAAAATSWPAGRTGGARGARTFGVVPQIGLVLPGGGARGAYEAGALSVLIPALEARGERVEIVCGTSVGGINAAVVAAVAALPAGAAGARRSSSTGARCASRA